MKGKIVSLTCLLFSCSTAFHLGNGQSLYNQAMGLKGETVIEEYKTGGSDDVRITNYCENEGKSGRVLTFKVKIRKEDNRGNRSATTQSGEFSIEPNEKKVLNQQIVNNASGSIIQVELQFFEDGSEILTDTTIRIFPVKVESNKKNSQKRKEEAKPSDPQLFSLGGFVLDETRTRVGRDLYDIFYSEWLNLDVKGDYTIKFEELPSNRGRGSIVRVFLNDQLIVEQFLMPNYEALERLGNALVPYLQESIQSLSEIQDNLDNELIGTDIDVY